MRSRKLVFYLLTMAAFAAIVYCPLAYLRGFDLVEEAVAELTASHEQQIMLFLETNRLLVTLASVVFGVVGAVILNFRRAIETPAQRVRVIFVFCLAGLSIYFGYLAQDAVLWMLESHFFRLSSPVVRTPSQLQFVFFLGAVYALSDFLVRSAGYLDRKE